jgi:STE24 endopeptidase
MEQGFTLLFVAALLAATLTRLWLAQRQIRHVRAHRAEVPGTFAEAIPLAAHQKAADYTVAKARLGMVDIVLNALVLLAFTLGGGIQWLIELLARVSDSGSLWHGTALMLSVFALQMLIGLPETLYKTFVIEERFGFNRMTLELFVWAVWLAFALAINLLGPPLIMPLFNKFTPLPEGEMADRVKRLLAKCGFKSNGLFLMDGSKRSSHGNAFFIGFGSTKRIVLFDTLVSRLQPQEVEAVLAHELGHYKLHHIKKRIAIMAVTSLAGLWILGQLADKEWFYAGLNVATPSTAAALLLFFMVVPEFTFFLHPLSSLYSRKHEFEADRYATAHADSRELVSALVKLYHDNAATLTPDPLHSAFYDSHPPAATRIARLRTA